MGDERGARGEGRGARGEGRGAKGVPSRLWCAKVSVSLSSLHSSILSSIRLFSLPPPSSSFGTQTS